MKIRSITCFINPQWPINEQAIQRVTDFILVARQAYQNAGIEVQSTRLATLPFPLLLKDVDLVELRLLANQVEQILKQSDFEYAALGPALPDQLESFESIPGTLAETENIFFSGLMTTPGGGISLPATLACARVIHAAAPLSPDGFANLRFAALANVPAGAPFFPAAYHQGTQPGFALAMEAADLAVQAFSQVQNLEQARQELIRKIEQNASQLEKIGNELASQFGIKFLGLDFTLAPFPLPDLSFGTAIENIGAPQSGLHGSLAAAAILADTLDQAKFRRTGFNGLMMPVLEDAILAERAAQGTLRVKDLLMYSAVCGTGLDTIPLPGDASPQQIQAVLLDLAALSQRLDKPLTARLMPIPGKVAGDPTGFDFAFFANSRVMALEAEPLNHFLSCKDLFFLSPRNL